uniref:Serine/threonine-protein phosphatase n=1 Tax=Hirondellea gigas TaxID=1518452 RepID=A0A6A7G8P4_9CRUS
MMDRKISTIPPPPSEPLDTKVVWKAEGIPNTEALLKHFKVEGRLKLVDAVAIVRSASQLFKREPNMLKLYDPITVCGDIHGQYYDLLRLLETGGDPNETQYLFLGDYVDRGCFSCEVVLLLYSLKIVHPNSFYMIRGNHECRHLTSFFNFKDECNYKYTSELYDEIMQSFDNLPIAATINNKFLCVHGGLSPDISTLADISTIDRFHEVPREGAFCDLLWADPAPERAENDEEDDDEFDEMLAGTTWFAYNDARQCSFVFGVDAVESFLKKNKLTAIIRAHEAQPQGFKMQMVNESTKTPRVITIFSAPNYCDVCSSININIPLILHIRKKFHHDCGDD